MHDSVFNTKSFIKHVAMVTMQHWLKTIILVATNVCHICLIIIKTFFEQNLKQSEATL